MFVLFLVTIFLNATVLGEVITLKNGSHITCVVTQDDTNSAIYLRPNSTKNVFPQQNTKILWTESDWIPTDSTVIQFKPITDFRWNQFPTFDISSYTPDQFGISLSACSVERNLTFSIKIFEKKWMEVEFNVPVRKKESEYCSWVHFALYNREGSVALISESFEDIRNNLNANTWIRFKRFPKYIVKRHLYKFVYANNISNQSTILNIESSMSGINCVHFYVSIDEGCELHIVFKRGNVTVKSIIKGFNIRRQLKFWKYIKLELNSTEVSVNGTIEFHRKQTSTIQGFWAIDHIRYCHKHTAIYTTALAVEDEEQTTCHSLNNDEDVRTRLFLNHTEVGCLGGTNCEVKCEDVLGPSYQYCQQHRICVDYNSKDDCFCAWGYKGDSCKEQCSDGTWGLECFNTCDQNCAKCNSRNGTCYNIAVSSTLTTPSHSPTSSTRKLEISSAQSTISSSSLKSEITSSIRFIDGDKNETIQTTATPKVQNESNFYYFFSAFVLFLSVIVIGSCIFLYRTSACGHGTDVPELGQSKVSIEDYDNYIRQSLSEGYLVNQFNVLVNDSAECNAALELKNIRRNYDRINIPYDKNRVVLKPMEDVGTSDYINASYIDGWGRSRAYIVTQGPKSLTMADFWRMVWQHDVKTIVMATNFRENMKRECVEYFPLYLDASLPVGELGIKLVKEECNEYYDKRILEVYFQKYHKVVTHYYLNWKPELGRPLYPNDLVPLVQIMNENYQIEHWRPVVVHCNLGVGRSAILIICDIAFEMAKSEGYVDVFDVAKMLREQRRNMITSSQAYILAHLVISECLMGRDQIFFSKINQTDWRSLSFGGQLESLNTFTWHDRVVQNSAKCGPLPITPYVKYLKNRSGNKIKYYYTKQPKSIKDVENFWMTVLRRKIKTILFLNELSFKPWPFQLELSERKICTVHHLETTQKSYCIISKIVIEERDLRTTTLYKAVILFIELLNWTSVPNARITSSLDNLLQLVEDVRNIEPSAEKILVTCLDGISDCGLFIAMSFIIRKYLKEVEYDVPNTIRSLRRSNGDLLSKSDELYLLHEAISVYSQKFDPYKNIDSDTPQET